MDSSNKLILPPCHFVNGHRESMGDNFQIPYTDTPRTRSSASSSNPGWKYRVFLSFYGEDTRKSFINHLLASLEDKWSLVFGNDDSLEHGKYLCQKLLKALQESICAIVVISKAHAFSKRCLVELTEILKCRTETELKVFPIFYHVNPSDVQNQKGDVERALAVHRESPEVDRQQMKAWRTALREVGGLVDGWRVLDDRYLAGIIEDIKENILRISSVEVSIISQVFVGIQPRVKEIMALLDIGSSDIQIIGIYGKGGIGKTTLAKVICDKVASQFDGRCFLVDFRERNKEQDIVYLRNLIHSMGSAVTERRVRSRKVFLILDDVNSREQLQQLANSRSWFAAGSRILVISRDGHLFHWCADKIYEVESLTNTEAFQLFCWNVFSKSHPDEGFLKLSQEVVDYARGLPLTLNILCPSLKDRTSAEWRSYIDEIRRSKFDRMAKRGSCMDEKTFRSVVKSSFERLENLGKEVLLDIACFFHGLHIDYIISKLDSLYDHPGCVIGVLRSKSWVKVTKKRKVQMHDLLRNMVLQIVDEKSNKLGEYSRLWNHKDIILVIKNKSGTNAVRGIVLDLPLQERIQLSIEAFSYMQGLRMLVIRGLYSMSTSCLIDDLHTVKWYGNPSKFILSNQLCILEWWGYPLTSLPTNFEPHNLVVLIMQQSCIEYLWMGGKVFEKLKCIDLIKSQNLIKTPDFNEVPNLEVLELGHCTSLCMVHPSIGVLKELKRLNLRGCVSLESLPSEVSCLPSLEVLDLSGNKFSQIPDSVWQLADLQELYLEDCSQLKLLSKLPFRLGHLHLRNCPSLYCFCDQMDTTTSSDIWKIWDTIDISFSSAHFHHGKPYRILHLHRRSPLRIKLRAQIFDTFVACGLTVECGTPEWFNQRSTPSFGSIGRRMDLDLDEDSEDWKGCAIFIDFEIHEHGNSNTRMSNGSNHTFLYFLC